MSKNLLSFLNSYFLITPVIAALLPPYRPNTLTLTIFPPSLLSNHVVAQIKETRAQVKMLKDNAEREARATYVVEVRPFGDSGKL